MTEYLISSVDNDFYQTFQKEYGYLAYWVTGDFYYHQNNGDTYIFNGNTSKQTIEDLCKKSVKEKHDYMLEYFKKNGYKLILEKTKSGKLSDMKMY